MSRQNNDAIAERLKFLWSRDGIAGAAEARRAYGFAPAHYESVKKWPTGEKGMTAADAVRVARHHHVSAGWLFFGEGSPDESSTVPLSGFVGAGQEITIFNEHAARERIDAAFTGLDVEALEVRGDSMYPVARAGDYVFFSRPMREFSKLLGQDAYVRLEDGRSLFKILHRGSKSGLFDLLSYNAEPMRDQIVHSAGALLGIKRRGVR